MYTIIFLIYSTIFLNKIDFELGTESTIIPRVYSYARLRIIMCWKN